MGQDAGLIHDILPAGEIVRRIAREAEQILAERLPRLVGRWSRDPAVAGRGHSSMASCNGRRRNAGLAEIPEQSRHRAQPSRTIGASMCSSGACCGTGIGMRHPDRAQAEHVGEGVVGRDPPKLGMMVGRRPVVRSIERAAQPTQGLGIEPARLEFRARRGAPRPGQSRGGRGGGAPE